MDRQNSPDLEPLVRMLQRSNASIGTNGTYNTATSDYFNDALPVLSVPNTPSGEGFEPEEISNPSINTKYQGGNSLPYYQVFAEVQRYRGESVGPPAIGSSAPGSRSVMDSYISHWTWARNGTPTPTLASGSSHSDSGKSEEPIPVPAGGPGYTHGHHRLRSQNHQVNNSALYVDDASNPAPPLKPFPKSKERRPKRASEIQKDNSTCFCLHGCEEDAEDGSRQPLSFTRESDRKRHYNLKHNPEAEIFHCPGCTKYKKTRLDHVRKHWKANHAGEGKIFKATVSHRVVSDRLRGTITSTLG